MTFSFNLLCIGVSNGLLYLNAKPEQRLKNKIRRKVHLNKKGDSPKNEKLHLEKREISIKRTEDT